MSNFKHVGFWWADNSIDLVNINGIVYALHGWNGELYSNCWKCFGIGNMDAGEESYTIKPEFRQTGEDQFEIAGYEVTKN